MEERGGRHSGGKPVGYSSSTRKGLGKKTKKTHDGKIGDETAMEEINRMEGTGSRKKNNNLERTGWAVGRLMRVEKIMPSVDGG